VLHHHGWVNRRPGVLQDGVRCATSSRCHVHSRYLPLFKGALRNLMICCFETPHQPVRPTIRRRCSGTTPSCYEQHEATRACNEQSPSGNPDERAPTSNPKNPPTHAAVLAPALATSPAVTLTMHFFSRFAYLWATMDTCLIGSRPCQVRAQACSASDMALYTPMTLCSGIFLQNHK